MQRLSHTDCSGETSFTASWYLPGDHSLPHDDHRKTGDNEFRHLTFIWYLTKNWQPAWGGHFFWCPASAFLPPAFNSLLLFRVDFESYHFVTHVTPFAQSKRLSINGWWTGKPPANAPHELRQPPGNDRRIVEIV